MINEINLDQQAFINKYLPADHNEQDVLYLKARFKWMHSQYGETKANWIACCKTYEGTTFQTNK
jgi:hypothetical protein